MSEINAWLVDEITDNIEVEDVEEYLNPEFSVVKAINRVLFEKEFPQLNKPTLAENLAGYIIDNLSDEEILSTKYGVCIKTITDLTSKT